MTKTLNQGLIEYCDYLLSLPDEEFFSLFEDVEVSEEEIAVFANVETFLLNRTKEELATELANSTESILDIKCPRNILNPGLYFGFIKGYEAALKNEVKK